MGRALALSAVSAALGASAGATGGCGDGAGAGHASAAGANTFKGGASGHWLTGCFGGVAFFGGGCFVHGGEYKLLYQAF